MNNGKFNSKKMKNSRNLTVSELQIVFSELSKEAKLQHEKDIDMYLSRGADVEKQTLIANVERKVTRPHTINSIGFTATITFKIRGKAYISEPYDDEHLLTHNGYTYYFAGFEFFTEAIDIEGYEIKISLPKLDERVSLIQDYKDLDGYPNMIYSHYYIDPREAEDVIEKIHPDAVLLDAYSSVEQINATIQFILNRPLEYRQQFIERCHSGIAGYKYKTITTAVSDVPKYVTKSQVHKYGLEKAIANYISREKKANDEAQICIDQLSCVIKIIENEGDTFNTILDYPAYKIKRQL